MKLPRPTETLAGCVWLPRILTKARLLQRKELAPDYEARFCHPSGTDGQFLSHFNLTREDVITAAKLSDDAAAAWFVSLPQASVQRINEWNHLANNLGRPGFPMAERFPVAMATTYKHLASQGLQTVFEALEADERLIEGSEP